MNSSSLAGHTIELLEKVVRSRLPSDRVIQDFYRERRYLGSHDRRWITEHLYAIVRNFILFREISRLCIEHPHPVHVFLVGEIVSSGMKSEELERAYRALWESYQMSGLKMDLASFCDCVCGRFGEIKQSAGVDPLLYSFPDFFVEMLPEKIRGESVQLMIALNTEARVCIRVDTNRMLRDEVIRAFAEEGVKVEPARFSPVGVYLPKRINLNNNLLYRQGIIEVQEEASQLVGLLINPKKDEIIVDACAGAGGKSLEIAALSQGKCKVYSLDVDDSRLRNLATRTRRSGYESVLPIRVSDNDLGEASALVDTADKVVVDAPCSGSGTIRRNPDKKFRLTKESVEKYSHYQSTLLAKYADLVKVGGMLVYSTCSIFSDENSGVVDAFFDSDRRFVQEDVSRYLAGERFSTLIEDGRLVTYPHRHDMDGFFAVVMKRVN